MTSNKIVVEEIKRIFGMWLMRVFKIMFAKLYYLFEPIKKNIKLVCTNKKNQKEKKSHNVRTCKQVLFSINLLLSIFRFYGFVFLDSFQLDY
jgi:hypothetical protein